MKGKAQIRPGKAGALVGLIAGIGFLAFGIFFFALLRSEGAMIGQVFMIFWIFIVLIIISVNAYHLISRKGVTFSEIELETKPGKGIAQQEIDFDARIRKLEKLKIDGLVSEGEYKKKRAEIIGEKW